MLDHAADDLSLGHIAGSHASLNDLCPVDDDSSPMGTSAPAPGRSSRGARRTARPQVGLHTDPPMSEQSELSCKPVPARRALAMSAVALLLASVAVYAFVAFPVYAHDAQKYFGISEGRLGLLLSSGAIGSLFSLLLVGPATDRLGARVMLQCCLAGTGLAFLVAGIGRSLLVFQIGLILAGFFGAAKAVSLPTFLICLYPEFRRRMVTISLISLAVPGIALPIVAERLLVMAQAGTMEFATVLHGPFLVGGALLLVGQFLLSFAGQAGEEDEAAAEAEDRPEFSLRSVLTVPALLIILMATLHAGADNAIYGWLPKFLQSEWETLPIGTGVMLGLYSAAYAVSRLGLAALPEGWGQRAFLVLPGPVGGLLIIAAIWTGGPLMVALAYPLAALFISVEYPTLLAEIRETSPARFSAIYGASIWTTSLLTILNVNLIGQVGQRTGDLRVGLTIAALGFIAFGVIAYFTGLGSDGIVAGDEAPGAEQAVEST
ncbi:MAG: MFS transporter [Armatimonadia bacterium]|nr:MFS transporter [Armatimonadia bacterium]